MDTLLPLRKTQPSREPRLKTQCSPQESSRQGNYERPQFPLTSRGGRLRKFFSPPPIFYQCENNFMCYSRTPILTETTYEWLLGLKLTLNSVSEFLYFVPLKIKNKYRSILFFKKLRPDECSFERLCMLNLCLYIVLNLCQSLLNFYKPNKLINQSYFL